MKDERRLCGLEKAWVGSSYKIWWIEIGWKRFSHKGSLITQKRRKGKNSKIKTHWTGNDDKSWKNIEKVKKH
jgi:hypothetical protein